MLLDLRAWEKALVAAAALLSLSMLSLYLGNFHFLSEMSGQERRIGAIGAANGEVRREYASGVEFAPISRGEEVFNGDVIVTNPSASAVIALEGGASLSLEPGSMVRLEFEPGYSMPGISRAVRVNVVTGAVSGKTGSARVRLFERGRETAAATPGADVALSLRADRLPFIPGPPPSAPIHDVALPEPALTAPPAPVALQAPVVAAKVEPSPLALAAPTPTVSPAVTPTEAPAPLEISKLRILEPKPGLKLRVPDQSESAVAVAHLKWVARPPGIPIQVSLHRVSRMEGGEIRRDEIFSQTLKPERAEGHFSRAIDSPGEYEWELRAERGESLAAAGQPSVPFVVEPEFLGIRTENPLVGGEESASNRLREHVLKEFDIQLRWKPYPKAEAYTAWIAASPTAKKPLLTMKAGEATSLSLNKGLILKGRLYYRISARLPSGFTVVSPLRPLIFDFLPPLLVGPKEGEHLIKGKAVPKNEDEDDNAVYFTWEKTNFTEAYFFELASDAQFKHVIVHESVDENFEVIPVPAKGRYFWRVRSLGKDIESGNSLPGSFYVN